MGLMNWISSVSKRAATLGRRATGDRRGNVAMMMALTLPVLVMATLGGIDIHRIATVRVHLQDALDAAALSAARSPYKADADLKKVGWASLQANLATDPTITAAAEDATFTLQDDTRVIADAKVKVKTIAAHIFLPPYGQFMDEYTMVEGHSEVTRASKNIEVALVLDVTGSMAGSRITALKEAATNLINIVVQPADKQQPYYSKVAIIPYSIGVETGQYADALRGALKGPTNISNAQWAAAASTNITKVERTNPTKVTSNGHGLATGDYVWIAGVNNVTSVNNKAYRVTVTNANEFTIPVSTTGSSNGTTGTVRKCIRSDCTVIVTSNGHGLVNGEYVGISSVGGMTGLNADWQVEWLTNNTFRVPLQGPAGNYSNGSGSAQCGFDGCQVRIFKNASGTVRRATETTTCITDRAGSAAYSDAAPGVGAWLGRMYRTWTDDCPSRAITPLSDRRADLVTEISRLQATGSTAGQIGFGMGWYTISNRFNSVWPSESQAGDYDPAKTLKAIIMMTDGEFNTTYCQGVLANDANYDGNTNQINCNATNGNPFAQTAKLCDEVKKVRRTGGGQSETPAVIIYTVGLSVSTSRGGAGIDTAREVLEYCATSPDRAKFATNSAQLSSAFEEFARDITRLRIAK